jgi:solute carrier family 8 (sodium/calcium exchanger)
MEPDENGTCPDINVYMCYDKGMLLPLVNEYTWPRAGRGTIYFIGLIWSFLGVAIIADIFMCSIEKITSKTRTIKVASQESEKGYEEIEVKVWNDTVANLTLMALGSSAPEILLSIIEICGSGFVAGALGPSTIVGSAAFNLLVITAICVIAIEAPDVRRIKHIKVFAVTAVFSIFAYVWLIIILVLVTPNYIDLWEAILTLLFFPILVILAYMADKDFCSKGSVAEDGNMELGFGE